MQITDKKQFRMYLGDYEGAIKDINELTQAIQEFTVKTAVVDALLDSLVFRAKFAGECWANLERLGFDGTTQEALIYYAKEEFFKGGENDQ